MRFQLPILLTTILALGACAAVIETRYNFDPPRSAHGQSCITQCSVIRTQCLDIDDLKASQCEQNAKIAQDSCIDSIRRNYHRDIKWYECIDTSSCSRNSALCESQYRSCYEGCGGKISSSLVCTANCDKLTPEQRRQLYGDSSIDKSPSKPDKQARPQARRGGLSCTFRKAEEFPIMPGSKLMIKNVPLKGSQVTISLSTKKSLEAIRDYYRKKLDERGCEEDPHAYELREDAMTLQYFDPEAERAQYAPNDIFVNAMNRAYSSADDVRWIQLTFLIRRD